MKITAESLMRNHQKNLAKLRVLEVELELARENPATQRDRAIIEAEVLKSPCLNGMPRSVNYASSVTEKVAVDLDSLREHDLNKGLYQLNEEIDRLRYQIHLFEAVITTLTAFERWLVDTLYMAGKTQAEALEIVPEKFHVTSRSTLSRHKKKMLDKIDAFLAELGKRPA